MEEFDYRDYMPDIAEAQELFYANGIEMTADCYDWIMGVDLMDMGEYLAMEMQMVCGWDNDTMMNAENVFFDYIYDTMNMVDDFDYMDYMPEYDEIMTLMEDNDIYMS